jgi:L-alanine-DL-glutamate epimerase-like enolase superfamily enzyme
MNLGLQSIRACALELPFKRTFAHASASRSVGQSLWVEVRGRDGVAGYGEGCPREYVTAETLAGALAFVSRRETEWVESIYDLASLMRWSRDHAEEIDASPAAWAAVELALLGLLGKRNGRSLEALLGQPEIAGQFRYTAVLGDSPAPRFEAELARYCGAGFHHFKIKLSGDAQRDAAKAAALHAAGIAPARVRADANNLWSDPDEAIAFLSDLDYPFMALEEPLTTGDYDGMARIALERRCVIILDESLLRAGQLDALRGAGAPWLVNLRISKMGGVLRALALTERVRREGLRIVVGAHVGETSLLTRTALTVAHAARDILVAQEGAFGTHLLERDVIEPPIMFGAGGVLEAAALPRRSGGLGLGTLDGFMR